MRIKSIIKYIPVHGGRNNKNKHPPQATIISILISSNKTGMSLSHRN